MSRPSGRAWAYAAASLGAVVSVAANIGHSYVPPAGAASSWHPHAGAVALAAFWPLAVLLAVEVLARVPWPPERRWAVLRWGGLTPVALVAAVVSYRHLSGLLGYYGEDGVTVALGPLAVDGLMTVATGALLATSEARGSLAEDVEPEAVDVDSGDVPQVDPGERVDEAPDEGTAADPPEGIPEPRRAAPSGTSPRRHTGRTSSRDVDDLLLIGQAIAAHLEHKGQRLTRDALLAGLRARGRGVSATRAGELLRQLRGAA